MDGAETVEGSSGMGRIIAAAADADEADDEGDAPSGLWGAAANACR